MKHYLKCKNILKTVCLVASIALSGSVSANLINGDFSDPSDAFNHWQGAVIDYTVDPIFGEEVDVTDFGLFAGNYSTSGSSVTLATDFFIGAVFLSQTFTFGDNVSEMSLDFLTDSVDIFSLVLTDTAGTFHHNFADPVDGLIADISRLANQEVSIKFSLFDTDLVADALTISNISISSLEVPEPSSIAFLAFGFFMMRRKLSAIVKIPS